MGLPWDMEILSASQFAGMGHFTNVLTMLGCQPDFLENYQYELRISQNW